MRLSPRLDTIAGMDSQAETLHDKFRALEPLLDERARRLWAAVEARALGRGGISAVARATGMSRVTVRAGLRELDDDSAAPPPHGVRRPGGGRKSVEDRDPALVDALQRKLEPVTRSEPRSALRWTCHSATHLAAELRAEGHAVSARSINRLLHGLGYSLQADGKISHYTERDAQFRYISQRVAEFQSERQPVVAVEAKKGELIGPFRDSGSEGHAQGDPEPARMHDSVDKELSIVTPYGMYDTTANRGRAGVDVDHGTAEFVVESLRRWWRSMGYPAYPAAHRLLVTAACGGPNSSRIRLWNMKLQELADEVGLSISVCHFPRGTSKWNEIEHRMVSHVVQNRRGRSPVSREVVVNLIGSQTTESGAEIQAELDEGGSATGRHVTEERVASLDIDREKFHGEWNYTLEPRPQSG